MNRYLDSETKVEEIQLLKELCKPLLEYLKEKECPYYSVTINESGITLNQTVIGIPIKVCSEE